MKTAKRYTIRNLSILFGTAEFKIAMSYLAAYLTAFAIVGLFYFSGLLGVGAISTDSFWGKLVTFALSLIN